MFEWILSVLVLFLHINEGMLAPTRLNVDRTKTDSTSDLDQNNVTLLDEVAVTVKDSFLSNSANDTTDELHSNIANDTFDEILSNSANDTFDELLSNSANDTFDEILSNIASDTFDEILSNSVNDTFDEKVSNSANDTTEELLSNRANDTFDEKVSNSTYDTTNKLLSNSANDTTDKLKDEGNIDLNEFRSSGDDSEYQLRNKIENNVTSNTDSEFKMETYDLPTNQSIQYDTEDSKNEEMKNGLKSDELPVVEDNDEEITAKNKDIEIILLESELKDLDNFQGKENGTENVQVFPNVSADQMLELLDNDIEMFEEMKKKVNLMEMQMKKKSDLHLFHQGAVGQIEAAEIILVTLTPFEENLEAVKDYVIQLDHKLDNSTADFVKKFVVRSDNFLKKAQESLKIVELENVNEKITKILVNIMNEPFPSYIDFEENSPMDKSVVSSEDHTIPYLNIIYSGKSDISEQDKKSAMDEDNGMESGDPKIIESNVPADWPGIFGGEVLKQNSIKLLEDVENEGVPKVEVVNKDEAINDNSEEDAEHNHNPKFNFLLNKNKESHQHLRQKASAVKDQNPFPHEEFEETGDWWMATLKFFVWFLVVGTGVFTLAILGCWLVGNIILKKNAYRGFQKVNNRKYATHRNC